MSSRELDEHFILFATSLKKARAVLNKEDSREALEKQQAQVEELWRLEERFRYLLATSVTGMEAYEKFITFIRDECHNILDARPYFRERQTVFTAEISDAFKARNAALLTRFKINYRFVRFVMSTPGWPLSEEISQVARAIEQVRQELVVLNMPLAIARARIFFSGNRRPHLELMDLVQIACIGLMSGIDKFEPPYSRMFRGVAIGRMVGDFIENNSATMLHLFPSDKRILYNVNKVIGRQTEDVDLNSVTERVNLLLTSKKKKEDDGEPPPPPRKATESEVAELLSAAAFVSMSATTSDDEGAVRVQDVIAAPVTCQPDTIVEQQDTLRTLATAIELLAPFERKFLKLKGIQLS